MRKHRLSIWVWLAMAAVATATVVAGLVYLFLPSLQTAGGQPLKQPRLIYGKQLKWRTLVPYVFSPLARLGVKDINDKLRIKYYNSFNSAAGGLVVGNFDADADDEIALCLHDRTMLYEVGGTETALPALGEAYTYDPQAWDCNHDGIVELVPEPGVYAGAAVRAVNPKCQPGSAQWQQLAPKQNPVIDLQGKVLGQVPLCSNLSPWNGVGGDADGDGWQDYVMQDSLSGEFWVYGKDGALLWTGRYRQRGYQKTRMPAFTVFGDIDADGKDEMLRDMDGIEANGLGQEPVEILSGDSGSVGILTACADLNGDGKEEVITSEGIIDPAAKKLASFSYPPGVKKLGICDNMVLFTLPGTTQRVIAAANGLDPKLLLFDATSRACIYCEDLGDWIMAITTARAAGKDHLIVQMTRSILIYP